MSQPSNTYEKQALKKASKYLRRFKLFFLQSTVHKDNVITDNNVTLQTSSEEDNKMYKPSTTDALAEKNDFKVYM